MVVLDTDLLIAVLRGKESAIEKVKELQENEIEISVTSITSYELYKGVYLSLDPAKNLIQISNLLGNLNVLHFDLEASKISGKVYSNLKKKGMLTNLMDLMIAAIAISKNERLLTKNRKHYENIAELKIEEW